MKITVEFDSEEEYEAFKVSGKKTRAKRGDAEAETSAAVPPPLTPAPMQPPAVTPGPPASGFPGASGFAPPVGGAAPQGGAFPAAAAPALAPEVQALVTRVITRLDAAIASGQPAEQVLAWFRGQCGPEAANADLGQIKTVFLAKLSQQALENVAKLMNA